MTESTIAVLALLVLGWAAVSGVLARHDITGPFVFAVAGYLLANPDWGPLTVEVEAAAVHVVAEVTLALVLFSDAVRVNLAELRRDLAIPVRLLGIGLVLSVVLGSLFAGWILAGLPWALAGFVGAALAPTDAALSVEVINDERIPLRLRRALNVESGLNDGIATPIVVFMLAVAASQLGIVNESVSLEIGAALRELGGGILTGIGVGIGGAVLISTAARRGWIMSGGRQLATLALAIAAFAVAVAFDTNGFLAAFVAGIAFGAMLEGKVADRQEATEVLDTRRRVPRARRLVPVRRDPRPARARGARLASGRVRPGESDRHPHAPGRAEPRALGTRPAQRRVHRLVRTAGTRVGGVRLAGDRRVGRDHARSPTGRRDRGIDGAPERGAPRHHRPSRRSAVRPERAEPVSGGTRAGSRPSTLSPPRTTH